MPPQCTNVPVHTDPSNAKLGFSGKELNPDFWHPPSLKYEPLSSNRCKRILKEIAHKFLTLIHRPLIVHVGVRVDTLLRELGKSDVEALLDLL
jgi:hypothetical protein